MSLIYFHIFLISCAIIFGAGFGFWELAHFKATGALIDLISAIGSFLAAAGLALYLAWFLKKNKTRING